MHEGWLIILALAGFSLSAYVSHKRRDNFRMNSFTPENCNDFVQSDYSSILGVYHDDIGMFYYSFILVLSILIAADLHPVLSTVILVLAGTGVVYSAVLNVIQLWWLKKFCDLFVLNTLIATGILLAVIL